LLIDGGWVGYGPLAQFLLQAAPSGVDGKRFLDLPVFDPERPFDSCVSGRKS